TAVSMFPQITTSGGYSTQFILFSGRAGQSSSGALTFFTQAGFNWDLATRQAKPSIADDRVLLSWFVGIFRCCRSGQSQSEFVRLRGFQRPQAPRTFEDYSTSAAHAIRRDLAARRRTTLSSGERLQIRADDSPRQC